MRKVFKVNTEEKMGNLLQDKFEFFVFAEDIEEAVKKVLDCLDKKMHIVNAKLYCVVEEDEDLASYKEGV